jgi:hypothetical protein
MGHETVERWCPSSDRPPVIHAAGTTPSGVVSFQPSEAVKERAADLIHREKSIGLSSAEKSELDHYLQLEHLMRLAKARAHQHISDA